MLNDCEQGWLIAPICAGGTLTCKRGNDRSKQLRALLDSLNYTEN